jgi:signal transduction histidine kinase/streptogramin lyase
LYEDMDGVLWIATDQGLYYTSEYSTDITNIYLSNLPGYYSVTDIIELQNGHYWLSTWGKGIITLDKNFTPYPSPLYKNMPSMDANAASGYRLTWSMCQQKSTQKIFIGCQSGQLMIYNPATGRTDYQRPEIFDNRTVRYITEDHQNNLWFGTQAGRIVKYDGTGYKLVLDLGQGAIIYKILIDKQGWAWVATHDKGVYAINTVTDQVEQHYTMDEGIGQLFANTCSDLEQLNDSIIYASTEALNIINKKTGVVQQVTWREGLPSNSIKRLRLDRNGYLWIITHKGLSRYDHKRKRFTSYGSKDGILMGEITDKADYICSEGYIMFAGVNSLLFFKPDVFRRSTPPPDVTLTDFLLGSEYQLLDSLQRLPEIRLKPDQNNFTISFACLDFKNRDKFIYYYKMNGLHKEWIRADRLSVPFTALAPGHYIFQVKAESLDGLVSKNISSLHVFIKPPFWRTKWFIATLLLIVALVAYSMHRLRLNRFFAVEKIRNRVARDLHDDMGSTLSTINILSSMAKAKLNTDTIKTGEYINKISDNSQRMMEAMDDIVWAIKPANDTMQKVVARMREFATNVFEAKEIDLEFKAAEEVNEAKINMEGRRDFFLIFKEAVNNAAKYSKCSKAIVHVYVENRKLILLVKDNGVGFDAKAADGGNGIGNMQKRTDALNGKLQLTSKEGEGTEVRLTVPLN